jgi:hypothetical protein
VRFAEGATGVAVGTNGLIYVSDSSRGLLVFEEVSAAGTGAQEGSAR